MRMMIGLGCPPSRNPWTHTHTHTLTQKDAHHHHIYHHVLSLTTTPILILSLLHTHTHTATQSIFTFFYHKASWQHMEAALVVALVEQVLREEQGLL